MRIFIFILILISNSIANSGEATPEIKKISDMDFTSLSCIRGKNYKLKITFNDSERKAGYIELKAGETNSTIMINYKNKTQEENIEIYNYETHLPALNYELSGISKNNAIYIQKHNIYQIITRSISKKDAIYI